ncbi:urease accessory protein UreF [Thalassoporum mexicanum]|uniref:urease accessory protein UreF n=1 Tax=Thalassoporum mexicanum TaxID=3457544 RepID=UPI001CEC892D|nr:urease accessory protein UreF [Pseudanabaena sp. PCC 7367]
MPISVSKPMGEKGDYPSANDSANLESININASALLHLLQLANATLPVGAYSYSEGLEALCEQGIVKNADDLKNWLAIELDYGSIRVETAVMIRAYAATLKKDLNQLQQWNDWFSASRETAELRQQSWQMGRSLLLLLQEMVKAEAIVNPTESEPGSKDRQVFVSEAVAALSASWGANFAIAFGMAAAIWQIDRSATTMAYLASWSNNLVAAGVKLIPLGQTNGQILILSLQGAIAQATEQILRLDDGELESCNFGLAQASMQHADLYSRLFRS